MLNNSHGFQYSSFGKSASNFNRLWQGRRRVETFNQSIAVKSRKDKVMPVVIAAMTVLVCLVVISFVPRAQQPVESRISGVAQSVSATPAKQGSDSFDGWERAESPANTNRVVVVH